MGFGLTQSIMGFSAQSSEQRHPRQFAIVHNHPDADTWRRNQQNLRIWPSDARAAAGEDDSAHCIDLHDYAVALLPRQQPADNRVTLRQSSGAVASGYRHLKRRGRCWRAGRVRRGIGHRRRSGPRPCRRRTGRCRAGRRARCEPAVRCACLARRSGRRRGPG